VAKARRPGSITGGKSQYCSKNVKGERSENIREFTAGNNGKKKMNWDGVWGGGESKGLIPVARKKVSKRKERPVVKNY